MELIEDFPKRAVNRERINKRCFVVSVNSSHSSTDVYSVLNIRATPLLDSCYHTLYPILETTKLDKLSKYGQYRIVDDFIFLSL